MIVMDRDNLFARGWSHVLSTSNDVAELETFRRRVGAPPAALQAGTRRWPHLDLRGPSRELALARPEVRVFERSAELLQFVRAVGEARRRLRAAARTIILTGAGVSAESGVPTFRGSDGLWQNVRAEELATPEAFADDPRRSWQWYGWRRDRVAACRPNAAHLAIARWMLARGDTTLVTQNVDGLHELAAHESAPDAGAAERAMPIRLHGSLFGVRCTRCAHRAVDHAPIDAASRDTLPVCPRCGALLRPDVVWFGEPLPERELTLATTAAAAAEVCLVVGTQGAVHPAAGLVEVARRGGAAVIVLDPGITAFDAAADVRLVETAARLLPELLRHEDGALR